MTSIDIERMKAAAFELLTEAPVGEEDMLAMLCGMDLLIRRLERSLP